MPIVRPRAIFRFRIRKVQEIELNKLREKFDKSQSDLLDDLNNKQDDLRQARLQIDLLKSSRSQVEQAQDQNQRSRNKEENFRFQRVNFLSFRLQNELKLARKEIDDQKGLIARYEKEITILEKQISTRGEKNGNFSSSKMFLFAEKGHSGEMSIRTSEMAELLEEMRRLRQELERSIVKQNELQAKLDENIRLTRTPKEFTFSGRALSYGEPRSIPIDELRSGNALSSSHDLGERGKYYFVGELEMHEALRRSLADLKVELRGIEGRINEKLRNKFVRSASTTSHNKHDKIFFSSDFVADRSDDRMARTTVEFSRPMLRSSRQRVSNRRVILESEFTHKK